VKKDKINTLLLHSILFDMKAELTCLGSKLSAQIREREIGLVLHQF
jgi:hypothetical protein